jgi:uncharacterized glyoxalase superfamily protein PhnB
MTADGAGRPTVYPALRYRDAKAAISFLKEAFGLTEIAVYASEDGTVQHAELAYGNGMVMLGSAQTESEFGRAAKDLGPSSIYVVVKDTDSHYRQATANGAEIVLPVTDREYGSRDYTARDPEGNLWSFGTYMPELPQ